MSQDRIPDRERQALREVGRTTVWFRTALATTLIFFGLVVAVPVAQAVVGTSPLDRFRDLGAGLAAGWRQGRTDGWLAGNRRMLAAMDDFETGLENESLTRLLLLPPVQGLLTRVLGAGNEQAYVGRGGWLHYRPDVDHVTGPGFLEPSVLERRRRGGEAWQAPPQPDPVPAIVALAEDLSARGIALLVAPVPVKPAILPGALVWRATTDPPLRNPSWAAFAEALGERGVPLLDVAGWIAEMPLDGESPYLTTDTHWTPRAMEEVARRLALEVSAWRPEAGGVATPYRRRALAVDGRGDIAQMLRLPAADDTFPLQRVTVSVVSTEDGRPWSSERSAGVLLLGDSFTNVFSDAALGWGRGAGLAEQLSVELERPLDRIALNAGGSSAARRALLDALVADPQRLEGKQVVVYQFAARELTGGDWPVLRLPPPVAGR
jgi:alginate O-acetyltransferase complex protein AlgJ